MPKTKAKKKSDVICDLRLPRPIDVVLAFAKAVSDGGAVPNINKGVMRRKEYDGFVAAHDKAMTEGTAVPSIPYVYQPAIVERAILERMNFGLSGFPSKHPKKPRHWPEYLHDYDAGEHISLFRLNHVEDVKSFVTHPDDDIVNLGSSRYVVGDVGIPAVFMVKSSRSGVFGHNINIGKEVSFATVKAYAKGVDFNSVRNGAGRTVSQSQLLNLVAKINSTIEIETLEDGGKIVWNPNHTLTWGFIEKDGKNQTPTQIRALPAEKPGAKFVALKEVWVGKTFNMKELWPAVRESMKRDSTKKKDLTDYDRYMARQNKKNQNDSAIHGLSWKALWNVQARVHPGCANCQGFRNTQAGIVPFTMFGDADSRDELIGFAIGIRLNSDLKESKWDAKVRWGDKPKTKAKTKKDKATQQAGRDNRSGKKKKAKKKVSWETIKALAAKRDSEEAPPISTKKEEMVTEVSA